MTLFQARRFALPVARFFRKNRRRSGECGAVALLSVLLVALPVGLLATTLTMDELPQQVANGLSTQGVTFTFTVAGSPSTDANYNFPNGGIGALVQDPSLEGNADGILQMDFTGAGTSSLSFSLARSTFGTLSPGFVVQLFDASLVSIGSFPITTNSLASFSEGAFRYSGTPVKRAVVSFPNAGVAPRFAIDNLTYFTTTTPAATTSICSPGSPAPISSSTGTLGVFDPTNATPVAQVDGGLIWPAGAVSANIGMETGQVSFFNAQHAPLGTAMLPGVNSTPAFPSGVLNFSAVRLTPGTTVSFTSGVAGLPQPIMVLSCTDIILDSGSTLTALAPTPVGPEPGGFMGANGSFFSGAGGYGPRTGALPSAGSLYPMVGGAGGNSGAGSAQAPSSPGGEGGPAILLSATQRVTVNGTIYASGTSSPATQAGSQGGGGGSVRLAGLLVEGIGTVNTSGGADSDGVVRSPAGPVEVQAFLQDLFAGTTSSVVIRGSLPVQPLPTGLPTISITQVNSTSPVFQQSGFSNTGSLTQPDVTLAVPSTAQVNVGVSISAPLLPDGTVLAVRAVGTDGSVATDSQALSQSAAVSNLTLNAGVTYQIVATPSAPFVLRPHLAVAANVGPKQPGSAVLAEDRGNPVSGAFPKTPGKAERSDISLTRQWMKAFSVSSEMAGEMAGEVGDDSNNAENGRLVGALQRKLSSNAN